MVVLGGMKFLMSEVPLYQLPQAHTVKLTAASLKCTNTPNQAVSARLVTSHEMRAPIPLALTIGTVFGSEQCTKTFPPGVCFTI